MAICIMSIMSLIICNTNNKDIEGCVTNYDQLPDTVMNYDSCNRVLQCSKYLRLETMEGVEA